jgi:hypothetical protein
MFLQHKLGATRLTSFMVLAEKTLSHNQQSLFTFLLSLSLCPTKRKVVPLPVGNEVNGPLSVSNL